MQVLKSNTVQIDRVHVALGRNVATHGNHFIDHHTLLIQVHVKRNIEMSRFQEKVRSILRYVRTRAKDSLSSTILATIRPLMHFRPTIGIIQQVSIGIVRLVTGTAIVTATMACIRHCLLSNANQTAVAIMLLQHAISR